ncbi:MAG: hypothetical protein QXR30_03510 [Candidatus Woesearchaeota archaeon]
MVTYDEKDFENLVKEFRESYSRKDKIFLKKREWQSDAKAAIFAIHRNEKSKAEKILKKLEEKCKTIDKLDDYSDFLEEFFEAELFYYYIKNDEIKSRDYFLKLFSNLKDQNDELNRLYISALSDFTGELVRLAVNYTIKENFEKVNNISETIELIYDYLIKCDITGDLRKKFDAIRWNLDKVHELLLKGVK